MNETCDSPLRRWPAFRDKFFSPPNSLRLDSGITALDRLIATAAELVGGDPPGPVVLPAVVERNTHYFAMAFTAVQSRALRELLQSHVGTTWTDFDGQSVHGRTSDDPLEQAVVAFAQDSRHVYRFRVAEAARVVVRDSIEALLKSVISAPRRRARLALPLGRMIADMNDACAAGAQDAANKAYATLAADHRISEANRLFLEVQLLAAFGRWTELGEHPSLDVLLKLPRPSLASDALAQLAMSRLPDPPTMSAFEPIGTDFGSLIESVSAIRSAAGTRYYTLWALAAGESPGLLRHRLAEAGWSDDPKIIALLSATPVHGDGTITPPLKDLRRDVKQSIEEGRFDTAVELLSELPTDIVDLPAVLEAVSRTLTEKALTLLERHRAAHGDETIHRALPPTRQANRSIEAQALPDKLTELFSVTSPQRVEELDAAIRRTGVAELRTPGGTSAACEAIGQVSASEAPRHLSHGLDICIDLVRDLKASEASAADIRSLGYQVLELWAYHDYTGDRHRAARIANLAGDLAELGLGMPGFDEVIELVRAGWAPFLTDADLPMGLDLLEQLIAYRPDRSSALDRLAVPMLSRVGPHNTKRIPTAALAVAVDLAPTFGLEIEPALRQFQEAQPTGTIRPGLKIGLYSLHEHALERTAKILRQRHPGLEVVACADRVSTEALRNAARSADLFVVMDRAAAHAATNALKRERKTAPISYAAGKGSTSMIEAAEAWLADQSTPQRVQPIDET